MDKISFRMEEEERKLLEKTAEARGETLSSFIRRSILRELAELSLLPKDRRKALLGGPESKGDLKSSEG